MGEIAIIHAPADRSFSCRMAASLAGEGHDVHRLEADDSGRAAGKWARADAVIVIWSPALIQASALLEEARRALARRVLVPVSIGDVEPPGSFAHLWPIDLAGWDGDVDDPRWQFVRDEISLALRRNEPVTMGADAPRPNAPPLVASSEKHAERSDGGRLSGLWMIFPAATALALVTGAALWAARIVDISETPIGGPLATFTQPSGEASRGADASRDDPAARIAGQSAPPQESAAPAGPRRDVFATEEEPANDVVTEFDSTIDLSTLSEAGSGHEIDMEDAGESVADDDQALTEDEGPDPARLADTLLQPAPAQVESDDQADEIMRAAQESEPRAGPLLPLPAPSEDNYAGVVFRDCLACPDMAEIPSGAIAVDAGGAGVLMVSVDHSFALSRRTVSFREWEACVDAGGCRAYQPDDEGWGRDRRPVINVSWDDAEAYAVWLSAQTGRRYRLPSEAEWEYAAAAGAASARGAAPLTPMRANFDAGSGGARHMTTPTASFAASLLGLYDMFGNVWEWTADCDSYAEGTSLCARRVLKGGAYDSPPETLEPSVRVVRPDYERGPDSGFRVARDLP